MKIYVGNLPFSSSENDVRELFAEHGQVSDVAIIMDRDTGRPRGFGFVEMPSDSEASNAINKLNGFDVGGRQLNVNEAKPREDRGGGGGGRGGYGGGGGGRGGYGGGGSRGGGGGRY
ncbi:MAG: RNA recognition motif domain-containing protein [Phycisphaerales bacterium]